MFQLRTLVTSAIVVSLFFATALGQEKRTAPDALKNPGLEDGGLGKTPSGWILPTVCAKDGYTLTLSDEKPVAGSYCALLSRDSKKAAEGFGNVLQTLDAKNYRGKRIRFKAAVRTEVSGEGNQAQLWLRVDREKDQMGFFDNMGDRPITEKSWKHYEIIGDIADDAESVTIGMMLLGSGQSFFDDVSFEVVDKAATKTTGETTRVQPAPGLTEVVMAKTVTPYGKTTEVTFLFPMPLAYRDQVPLTFHLTVDPPEFAKATEVVDGSGDNRILKLSLHNLEKGKKVAVEYRSLVFVAPTKLDAVPQSAKYPKDWPAETKPWLESTWCADHENERLKKLATEIRGDSDDVMAVIAATLKRAKDVFANTKGRVGDLTAVEALDKSGSCTSCANLVAALLRGAGIPARILAGYPLWSGPLQTHYIVEAYVPGFGWYPVESTMCQAPWPNHQQVNVSIIPIEYERKEKACRRNFIAGGVPYLSLTEIEQASPGVTAVGTLKPYCDHECQMVRAMSANDAEWSAALAWAKPRWASWLKSQPSVADGKIVFGPKTDAVKGNTPAEVQRELK